VDAAAADNIRSLCMPSAECGIEGEYTPVGGEADIVAGKVFLVTVDTICTEGRYQAGASCTANADNCDAGQVCDVGGTGTCVADGGCADATACVTPRLGQDDSCANRIGECDTGLVCAHDLVDSADAGNIWSLCVAEASCAGGAAYAPTENLA